MIWMPNIHWIDSNIVISNCFPFCTHLCASVTLALWYEQSNIPCWQKIIINIGTELRIGHTKNRSHQPYCSFKCAVLPQAIHLIFNLTPNLFFFFKSIPLPVFSISFSLIITNTLKNMSLLSSPTLCPIFSAFKDWAPCFTKLILQYILHLFL